jgi:hypothetical protein
MKDLAVTAGWGHAGYGGVAKPGKGKLIERGYVSQSAALSTTLRIKPTTGGKGPVVLNCWLRGNP